MFTWSLWWQPLRLWKHISPKATVIPYLWTMTTLLGLFSFLKTRNGISNILITHHVFLLLWNTVKQLSEILQSKQQLLIARYHTILLQTAMMFLFISGNKCYVVVYTIQSDQSLLHSISQTGRGSWMEVTNIDCYLLGGPRLHENTRWLIAYSERPKTKYPLISTSCWQPIEKRTQIKQAKSHLIYIHGLQG